MKRLFAAIVLVLALAQVQAAKEGTSSRVVLPNSELLRCKSSDCYQLWSGKSVEANAIFPTQISVDTKGGCIYGLTARYDKSVALDDIKTAINVRYGRWVLPESANSPIKLWRVESERFAIQLVALDKKDERRNIGLAGSKQAIYIAFGGSSACDNP